jgi:acyl CoA:acetate/3-ketoacid CoA transferase beta subunit
MAPEKMVLGRGGAKDLVAGANHVIIAMVHAGKAGPRIAPRPLPGARRRKDAGRRNSLIGKHAWPLSPIAGVP